FRQLFNSIGIDASATRAVSLSGGSAAVTETAGGHIDIGTSSWGALKPLHESGQIRILAVADDERFEALPDVPTTSEAGYPDVNLSIWIGVSGPVGLPDDVVTVWEEGVEEVLQGEGLKEKFENIGLVPTFRTGADMATHIDSEA